jgi:hypothetical protein
LSMATITFTVKSTAAGYWLAVDQTDLNLINGSGSINLSPGSHSVTWWFVGNPGDSIGFVGMNGKRTVVQVKESKIPEGETVAGNFKRFDV